MEASTAEVGQRQSVAVQVDSQGNGVQEVQGVKPEHVLDPQFDQEDQQGDLAVESSTDGNAAIRVTGAPADSTVTVTYASAQDQSGAGAEEDPRIAELTRLKNDGIISEEEYNAAASRVNAGAESTDQAVVEGRSDVAAAQSPGEPQSVPEVRPQAAVSPSSEAGVSDASKRAAEREPGPMGVEEIERANSQEAKDAADENSRMPNLVEGQRVVLTDPHEEAGRMAYVLSIHYTDGIQDLIARSPSQESRFAEVDHYVLRTRDGRSDLIMAAPNEVKTLEINEGWGRGQI